MEKVIGFIGGGNMGGAIVGGIVKSNLVPADQVIVSDIATATLERLQTCYGVQTTTDNVAVAQKADVLFLAVKPFYYQAVVEEIRDHVKADVVIVTIAAGKTIADMESAFKKPIKIVRTMPNTPAMVGQGMTALCPNSAVVARDLQAVQAIFNSVGKSEVVTEALIDAVIGVSGSSPAYVYMFIEAMADVAVQAGMMRPQAYQFAAQAVLGSAQMVLESGMHPGALKDMVCTPGGSTIDAVIELEKSGMRGAVMSGMQACIDKAKAMSNGK